MLKRVGIWTQTDPDHLAESRSAERREEQELSRLVSGGADAETAAMDINLATREELDSLPGLGPVMVETIMAGRPYTNRNDLLRLRGFGPKRMEQVGARLVVSGAVEPSP